MKKLLNYLRGRFFEKNPEIVALNEKEKILKILNEVDKTNPKKRAKNIWDLRFLKAIPRIYRYEEALDIVNKYGCLSDTYLENLGELKFDVELQLALCKLRRNPYDNKDYARYSKLLCYFLRKWDFAPEVKTKIFDDERYERVRYIYTLCRED